MVLAVLALTVYSVCAIASRDIDNTKGIALVIGSFVSLISSIIILPQIIAEHLFPKQGDMKEAELVYKMLDYDAPLSNPVIKSTQDAE